MGFNSGFKGLNVIIKKNILHVELKSVFDQVLIAT